MRKIKIAETDHLTEYWAQMVFDVTSHQLLSFMNHVN